MAAPVKAEPVFFVLTFLMCIEQPIHWMCYILDNRVEQTLQFVQGLSIEFAVVYLATCLIYWVKGKRAKNAVKALLYMLFWTLMGITLFWHSTLRCAFRNRRSRCSWRRIRKRVRSLLTPICSPTPAS